MSNSQLFMLGHSNFLNFSGGAGQMGSLTNNFFNLSSVAVSGRMLSTGNCWQGNPTVMKANGAQVSENGDPCGTIVQNSPGGTPKGGSGSSERKKR
ncbi:MAG TPA: hypothetical protein VHY56_03575 [Candidatus Binataceae bacterium]|nr:hypothetical protein [Candidatus Binataceae bacterium]